MGFEQEGTKGSEGGGGWREFFLTGDKEEEGVGSVFFWEAGFFGRTGVDGLWRF